jgi:hypothetical protein
MRKIVLECVQPDPRNDWHWQLRVPCPDVHPARDPRPPGEQDIVHKLVLVGMYHACDSAESFESGVFRELYDSRQCENILRDGDVIESKPCRVSKYHSYENREMIDLPAMRFRVQGVHVIPEGELNYSEK